MAPVIELSIPIGLEQEGIYRLSGMKSKIEELKATYDKGMTIKRTCNYTCNLHTPKCIICYGLDHKHTYVLCMLVCMV